MFTEKKYLLELYFFQNKLFVVEMAPNQDVIRRWVVIDGEQLAFEGEPGEGTTVDTDEPFFLIIRYPFHKVFLNTSLIVILA